MASSKSTKSPAFQFYAADFLHDDHVEEMSFTERGIYITLLCLDWLGNGLPCDPDAIARRIRMPEARFRRVWDGRIHLCFDRKGERLFNPRLARERAKQRAFRDKQADNGAKGGRPSKKPKPLENESQAFSLSKARARDERSGDETNRDLRSSEGGLGGTDYPFDAWWLELLQTYPEGRRKKSLLVNQLFIATLEKAPDGVLSAWARLRANLAANVKSQEWRRGMAPMLDKYLEDGRWEDVIPEAPLEAAKPTSHKPAWLRGA